MVFFIEGDRCLEEVIHIIEDNLNADQQQLLIQKLPISASKDEEYRLFSQKLVNIPWSKIKFQLEVSGRLDVVEKIHKTLITEGELIEPYLGGGGLADSKFGGF